MSIANVALRNAAKIGDVAEIERQIAVGADPNAFDKTSKDTPLQWAAQKGHVAAMAALLKAGGRVDGEDSEGVTPLMWASRFGHTAAVDVLVAAGADVHRASEYGDTALHYASTNGRLGAARVLLEAGAKTDVRNSGGDQPIDLVRSLARSLRPRDHVTSLRRRVAIRRFAVLLVRTSPNGLP
jgi:ankyrin repeat protein